jgi:hypothetical protein
MLIGRLTAVASNQEKVVQLSIDPKAVPYSAAALGYGAREHRAGGGVRVKCLGRTHERYSNTTDHPTSLIGPAYHPDVGFQSRCPASHFRFAVSLAKPYSYGACIPT